MQDIFRPDTTFLHPAKLIAAENSHAFSLLGGGEGISISHPSAGMSVCEVSSGVNPSYMQSKDEGKAPYISVYILIYKGYILFGYILQDAAVCPSLSFMAVKGKRKEELLVYMYYSVCFHQYSFDYVFFTDDRVLRQKWNFHHMSKYVLVKT